MFARPLTLALLAFLAPLTTLAQQSLADLVAEARADWMFGKWEATTDNGATFSLEVSWDLDKKVCVFHGKGADMEFKGYTFIETGSQDPKYVAFDNRGVVTKGQWSPEGGDLVLKTESHGGNRGDAKMGAVFAGSAAEGLTIRMHGLTDAGNLEDSARMTLKFKKQK